jgi:hypothetical protein
MDTTPLKTLCRLPKGLNCLHNPDYLKWLFELEKKRKAYRKAKVYKNPEKYGNT